MRAPKLHIDTWLGWTGLLAGLMAGRGIYVILKTLFLMITV